MRSPRPIARRRGVRGACFEISGRYSQFFLFSPALSSSIFSSPDNLPCALDRSSDSVFTRLGGGSNSRRWRFLLDSCRGFDEPRIGKLNDVFESS